MFKLIGGTVVFLVILFGGTPLQASEIRADSRITAVTVYPGSAKVTRSATLRLEAGSNAVVIDDLPLSLVETSLRVAGEGQGRVSLGSVQLQRQIQRDVVQQREKALRERIEQVEEERRVVSDDISRQQSQLAYIRQMVMGGNTAAKEEDDDRGGYSSLPLEQWQQAWQTLESATADVQQKIRESEKALKEADKTLDKLRRELRQVATNRKETLGATLQVESSMPTELALTLSYQVKGARWEPVYDADLDTDKGEIHLKTLAQISQRTGEDWKDVEVTLSTMRPSADSQLPELNSWVLDFMPPPPPMPVPMAEESADMAFGGMADEMRTMRMKQKSLPAAPVATRRMEQAESRLVTTDFTAEYRVPGAISLESGSDKRRFALASEAMPAKVNLASAPRFDPRVMIQAETEYTKEVPLIAGNLSLYRNGSFVGTTYLQEKLSGEEIRLSFGEDSKVKIVFQPDPDQKRKDGFFSKKKVVERHYKVTISNNHDKPYAIRIFDVLPVAAHEEIKVESRGEKPTEQDVDDKKGVVSWNRQLEPKSELVLTYGYSVSYPEEQRIPGL